MQTNKIYYENCKDTLARMPDNFLDATITSPPYDNLRKYNGFKFDFEKDFRPIAKELYRVTKKGGVVVWVVGDQTIKGSETGTSFKQALYFKEIGFNLHDTMLYRKLNFIPLTHNRYEQAFEYMFVFSKGAPKTFNPILTDTLRKGEAKNYALAGSNTKEGGYRRRAETIHIKDKKFKTNIFEYGTGSNLTKHPAPFPEKLADDQILSWTNKGDLIYDSFTGSGTTAKMCILNNRKFIGSEVSELYKPIIEKRISGAIDSLLNLD
jgi:DNA modification methylase